MPDGDHYFPVLLLMQSLASQTVVDHLLMMNFFFSFLYNFKAGPGKHLELSCNSKHLLSIFIVNLFSFSLGFPGTLGVTRKRVVFSFVHDWPLFFLFFFFCYSLLARARCLLFSLLLLWLKHSHYRHYCQMAVHSRWVRRKKAGRQWIVCVAGRRTI